MGRGGTDWNTRCKYILPGFYFFLIQWFPTHRRICKSRASKPEIGWLLFSNIYFLLAPTHCPQNQNLQLVSRILRQILFCLILFGPNFGPQYSELLLASGRSRYEFLLGRRALDFWMLFLRYNWKWLWSLLSFSLIWFFREVYCCSFDINCIPDFVINDLGSRSSKWNLSLWKSWSQSQMAYNSPMEMFKKILSLSIVFPSQVKMKIIIPFHAWGGRSM